MLLNGKMIGVLAVILVLVMAVGVAGEEMMDASGQWMYVLEDGGVMITGYVEEPSGELVIPAELDGYPVTSIGANLFIENETIVSVTIPIGVKRIEEGAFYYCDSLETAILPDGLLEIGESAFESCLSLTYIEIPESVEEIGNGAFSDGGLQSIKLPSGLTSIPWGAFSGSALTSIQFPKNVYSIGGYAFSYCDGLTDVRLPASTWRIGEGAFASCENLASIFIPATMRFIHETAFMDCDNLTVYTDGEGYVTDFMKIYGIPYEITAPPAETADEFVEITANTAEELLAALGSNRRVILEEGVYNLTDAELDFISNANVYYRERYDGPELFLKDIHNLTIQGAGYARSEIVVEPRYAFVMSFLNCTNISITNLSAGHTDDGECQGGVFQFASSTGIYIDNTWMYGCGTVGLNLSEVTDVKAAGSTIFGCTDEIMEIEDSSDILFADCVFRDNIGRVVARTTSNLTFDSCSFLRNANRYPMFSVSGSENVVVKNSEFIDNGAYEGLVHPNYHDIEFDASNRFQDNTFDETY